MQADCDRCAALCCMTMAFDQGPQFAFDKPAGVACSNLDPKGRCSIHPSLAQKGFSGCIRYTCFGAGQRITQELFAGQSWQHDPNLTHAMIDAFRAMRQVHELLILVLQAQNIAMSPVQAAVLKDLNKRLQPENGWTTKSLSQFENGPLAKHARDFFKSLRDAFP